MYFMCFYVYMWRSSPIAQNNQSAIRITQFFQLSYMITLNYFIIQIKTQLGCFKYYYIVPLCNAFANRQ